MKCHQNATRTAFPTCMFIVKPSSIFFNPHQLRKPCCPPRPYIRALDDTEGTNPILYQTGKIKDNIRVFLDQSFIPGKTLRLPTTELRHLRARRTQDGDTLLLFNNEGHTATAVLQKSDAAVLTVSRAQPARPSISVIVGLPKSPNRTDCIIEKLTELGATSITFACTARSTSRPTDAKIQRWHRIAVAAAKQCLRTELPRIFVLNFDEVLLIVEQHQQALLFCSGGQPLLGKECANAVKRSSSVLLLIGPEGGFDDTEINALAYAGSMKVSLGVLRLRVETAAIVAAGVVNQMFVQHNKSYNEDF